MSRHADSWGGRALRLLAWSTILGAFTTNVIDGTTRITTATSSTALVANGNVGGIVGVVFFGAAVVSGGVGILRVRPSRSFRFSTTFGVLLFSLIGWWILSALVLRHDPIDQSQMIFILGVSVVTVSAVCSPPTLRTLHAFNLIRDVTAALLLVTSIVHPVSGQLPCRADKCGIFGSLYTGFFDSENAAAMLVVFLVPAAVTIASNRALTVSLGLAGLFVLSSGSRTALFTFAVVAVFVLSHRSAILSGQPREIRWYWRALPLTLLAVSAYVFLTTSGAEFTGRGWVYAAIKSQLSGYAWLTGTGPSTLDRSFEMRVIGFDPVGEHGMAPHLLVEAGIVGLLLYAAALLWVATRAGPWTPAQAAAFTLLLSASLQSVTEPGWMLVPRSLNFVSMVLALGLFQLARQPEPGSEISPRGRTEVRNAHERTLDPATGDGEHDRGSAPIRLMLARGYPRHLLPRSWRGSPLLRPRTNDVGDSGE